MDWTTRGFPSISDRSYKMKVTIMKETKEWVMLNHVESKYLESCPCVVDP